MWGVRQCPPRPPNFATPSAAPSVAARTRCRRVVSSRRGIAAEELLTHRRGVRGSVCTLGCRRTIVLQQVTVVETAAVGAAWSGFPGAHLADLLPPRAEIPDGVERPLCRLLPHEVNHSSYPELGD
jgi:hypothetical protein